MKEKQHNKKIQKQKSAEEQKEEIEALKSIFQDDFEELHAGQEVNHKFAITIDASSDKKSSFASVKLEISLGVMYPRSLPTITVVKLKGLSDVIHSTQTPLKHTPTHTPTNPTPSSTNPHPPHPTHSTHPTHSRHTPNAHPTHSTRTLTNTHPTNTPPLPHSSHSPPTLILPTTHSTTPTHSSTPTHSTTPTHPLLNTHPLLIPLAHPLTPRPLTPQLITSHFIRRTCNNFKLY
jgi:RWD domain